MDDKKVYELKALELAYRKQLQFIWGLILISIIGLIVYIINIYKYNFALLITAIVIILTSIIGIMTIDQKMKLISEKIRKL
jgi:uncharacterized membrane protein YqjE